MAASNTVNDLVAQVHQWLDGTGAGRSVYDDMVLKIMLYQLDKASGAYVFDEQLPVVDRQDIIKKVRALGGR